MPPHERLPIRSGLWLQTPGTADAEALVRHLNNPAVTDWLRTLPSPYTASDALAFIQFNRQTVRANGQRLSWGIFQEGEGLIGSIGFGSVMMEGQDRDEIGYWLGQPYWGQGLATEVLAFMLAQSPRLFGLHELVAHTLPGNTASERVLEKCGFHRQVLLENYFCKTDRPHDVWRWHVSLPLTEI